MLIKLARYKRFSLLRKVVTYGCKKFNKTVTWLSSCYLRRHQSCVSAAVDLHRGEGDLQAEALVGLGEKKIF